MQISATSTLDLGDIEFPPKLSCLFEPRRYKVLYGGRGGSKCLGKGTRILTYAGNLVKVEDIKIGDILMGPDSFPRTVRSITSGTSQLFRVSQAGGAESYIVNGAHRLSLRKTHTTYFRAERGNRFATRYQNEPDVVNISVVDYLAKSAKWKAHFLGYKAPCIHFAADEHYLPVHPYFLGYWLGDGTSREMRITVHTADWEVTDWCKTYVRDFFGLETKLCVKAGINAYDIGFNRTGKTNPLWALFKELGVANDKHIPHSYQVAPEQARLELLAGLIDSDGHCHHNGYIFCNTNKELALGVKRLADFLGFKTRLRVRPTFLRGKRCSPAFLVSINGDTWRIPCKLPRKQVKKAQCSKNKDFLLAGITVAPIGIGEYFGFEVDGDHLFLLADGTVTHNSWNVARALLIQGLDGTHRILCARELQASIKDSVHRLISDQISRLGMNYLYDVQQQGIYGIGQAKGTEFSFEGIRHNTTKVKSYEGLTRCWIEEADKLSEESFDVIRNTLRRDDSELWFTFNPDQEDDFIYQRFCLGEPSENAFVVEINWRDNPWFPEVLRREMEEDRASNYDKYLHIWEGKTRVALDGAVFGEELREVIAQGRVCHVPLDRAFPVNAIFDLGRSDHTSIWFHQQVGFEHHLVDFYQNRLKHIDHYLQVLQARGYTYGLIWLPHDAKAKTLGTKMSVQEQVSAVFGAQSVRIVPKLSVPDRINAARTILPTCYFDEARTKEGFRSLKHYHYDVLSAGNSKLGIPPTYSKLPVHDWASDAADAFCYLGVASKQRVRAPECKLELPKSTLVGKLGEFLLPSYAEGDSRPSSGWLGR